MRPQTGPAPDGQTRSWGAGAQGGCGGSFSFLRFSLALPLGMTDFAAPTVRVPPLSPRRAALAAALALGLGVGALALRLSPTAGPGVALGVVVGLAALGLAGLAEAQETPGLAKIFAGLAAFAGLGALRPAPENLELAFALGALGLLAGGAWTCLRAPRLGPSRGAVLALAGATLAALAGYNAYYVLVSRDLMIADFMFYRIVSVAVGTLARDGNLLGLVVSLARSMPKDYSWAPALAPGLTLAAFGLLSRAVYQGAILTCYALPALVALAFAAREIAGAPRRSAGAFAFALAAVAAAYPFAITVAARGMPDIGGLALFVIALRLAAKLAQALSLPAADRPKLTAMTRKLAFALALTLFAMFLFRRWYAFAAAALLMALAGEVAVAAARRRGAFRWREAALAACIGLLTLLALLSPVLVDWLPDPAAHDYARMYAAYRKTPAVLAEVVGDWAGFAVIGLALAGGLYMLAARGGRFARLAFVTGPLAALLFLRVQSPYPHHLYLIAPFLMLFIAAPLLRLHARSRGAGLAALAALAALTLTPAGAWLPKGLFPTAARPHAPRADLAELARMKAWVDARATPSHKVCGLGSSYTFSGQLIGELWQLKADKSPLTRHKSERVSVGMTDVDTVDGPPTVEIKDCAVMLVGDPVQTHVIPSYQLTVTLPSREMLTGVGIGAHYRRTGEVFHLEHGVNAVVFEQVSPLTDADMQALAARWRAARAEVERAQ